MLGLTTIVFSFIQISDRGSKDIIGFNESICSDSIFAEYRPFRVVYESMSNSTNATKICTWLTSNPNVTKCFMVEPKDGVNKLWCGWSTGRLFERLGISAGQVLIVVICVLWLWKEWKIAGGIVVLMELDGILMIV